jgi:hypothetical protein
MPETGPWPQALNLLAIQGARPPLSQSLRPARPLEERERGAGEREATFNVAEERERRGGAGSPRKS